MFRKSLAIILCVCFMLFTLGFGTGAIAQTIEGGDIIIDNVEAYAGNSVLVGINIENNPGIMALTVGIGYDASVLSYEAYDKGNVFTDYTVAAYPEENLIRFVVCESKNVTKNGTMLFIRFKISKTADVGEYPVTLKYSEGDFSNCAMDYIMPTVQSGSVTVHSCEHPDSKWITDLDPTFEACGNKNRVCVVCGLALEKESIIKLVYGDLSRDGLLKSNDLVGLKRFILGTLAKENYEEQTADVSGDGIVDIRDLVRFKKYFAGISVTLGKPEENTDNPDANTSSSVQSSESNSSNSTESQPDNTSSINPSVSSDCCTSQESSRPSESMSSDTSCENTSSENNNASSSNINHSQPASVTPENTSQQSDNP